MISQLEASKRIGSIEALENQLSRLQKEVYTRKANLLQTYYGFKMEFKSHTAYTFTIDENIFCDIDDAMEFAVTNHSTGSANIDLNGFNQLYVGIERQKGMENLHSKKVNAGSFADFEKTVLKILSEKFDIDYEQLMIFSHDNQISKGKN